MSDLLGFVLVFFSWVELAYAYASGDNCDKIWKKNCGDYDSIHDLK